MTRPTPHGQVPEALRLAEQYDHGDPAAHGNAWKAAVCTELRRLAELEAQIEALSGVQALSAAPRTPTVEQVEDEISMGHGAWDMVDPQELIGTVLRLSVAASPPAEQQATTTEAALGGVYAELPDPGHRGPVGTGSYFDSFTRDQMRDFADRTHAARLRCKSEQARLATLWGYVRADATTKQAAPKAVPGESLTRDQIREVFMAHGFTIKEGQTDLKQYVYDAACALLSEAPQPAPDCHHRPPCDECAAIAAQGGNK